MDEGEIRSQIWAIEARISDCEAKIGRLKPVKELLAAKKTEFKSFRESEKQIVDASYHWTGVNRDDFRRMGNELLSEEDQYYSLGLDTVHDAVNTKITELENRIANEVPILGSLYARLNDLANAVENVFN